MAFDPSATSAALELCGLAAGYRGRPILHDLSLALAPGDSVALIGPNGCGKSTLFRVLAGLLRTTAGSIRLAGADLLQLSPDSRARRGLGYLKQTANMFSSLTVRDNLLLAGEVGAPGRSSHGRLEALEDAFPLLRRCSHQRAGLLSGGQRQTLAVAMVLMRQPSVLLLDEPIAGLSPAAGLELLTTLNALRQREGFALLIVEHRLRQLQPFINGVLVMREGSLVASSSNPDRLLDADWLASHFRLASPP